MTSGKYLAGSAAMLGWLLPTVWALQPPRPGEVEKYIKDGSWADRYARSLKLGNHRTHPHLLAKLQRKLAKGQQQTAAQAQAAGINAPPPAWQGGLPSHGTPKALVLLVDFPEYPHDAAITQADVYSKFFGSGPPAYAPYESLRNYYQRASYSQLTLQGTVLDWYRATHGRSYYQGLGDGPGQEALMMEALNYWEAQGHDFSQYDNDGDGTIDAFFIKWTGPDNGWANFWWAYMWGWHSNPGYRLDGKAFGAYVWSWIANTNYDGHADYYARTDIHETGHLLGLPDLYDYNGSIGPKGGVGGLDMMHANWGDHNCFSKFMLEWLTPTQVSSGVINKTLNPSGTSQDCVLVMRGLAPGTLFGEFFMAQYRKRSTGNDPSNYPTDGLLIWHIDSTLNGSGTDFLYDNSYTAHKYIRLMEADGLEEIEQNYSVDAGDFYVPGCAFNNTTAPNSRNYSAVATGVTIDQLTSPGATMSGRFGVITTPLIGGTCTLVWEGCYPPNANIDPDEAVLVNISLSNGGSAATYNLVATLQETGGVVAPSLPQGYGALVPGGGSAARMFMFRATGTCGGGLTLTLALQDGATNLGTVTFSYVLGTPVQGGGYDCCHNAPGDFDHDGDVDQSDYGILQACLSGTYVPPSDPNCAIANLNPDDYVDTGDVNIFANCLTGPEASAEFDCR